MSINRWEILSRRAWYVGEYEVGEVAAQKAIEARPNITQLYRNLSYYWERKIRTKGEYEALTYCSALHLTRYAEESPRVEFVILVTSYNTKKYVRRNLDSLIHQRSTFPYEIIVVDDGSTDGTGKEMDDYAQEHALPFLKIIHNPVRKGSALENIYTTVHELIRDHKIVVCCDGDDTFSCNGVLERLEKEYANPDVWMTYGRFVVYPAGEFWSLCWETPEEVIRSRTFRHCSNVPSHLKTFRAGLFKKIKKEDLLDPTGNFL